MLPGGWQEVDSRGMPKLSDLLSRQIPIHTSPEQDQQIFQFIMNLGKHPGFYDLFGRNCAQFVADALHSAGFSAPSDITPYFFLKDLHSIYNAPAQTPENQIPLGDGLSTDTGPFF
jgi:Domain of unknown function (DUF4105)